MKKKTKIEQIQRDIILKTLVHVPFDGWTKTSLERGAIEAGYKGEVVKSAFPNGLRDCVAEFGRYIDDQTMMVLDETDVADMRVRDRIIFGVQTRLEVLQKYREAERLAVAFWSHPRHTRHGLKIVWRTADMIWNFAGDTATDYNRYTKRGLLSGVLTKTTLYWLQDESDDYEDTKAFLIRQIDGIVSRSKILGRFKAPLDMLWSFRPFKSKNF